MKISPKHAIGICTALLAIFTSITLLSYLNNFHGFFLKEDLLNSASPAGIFVVFGLLLFAGVYFFNAAGKIIKETIK
ncbi:MAG TPA: hypothetical protein VJG83_06345 [archaeon]|nr:hypothetical protein [archaeon]